MMFNTKRYNREIEALKAAAAEPELHPLRQEQLKQRMLQQLPSIQQGSGAGLVNVRWSDFKLQLMRYLAPTVAGLVVVGGTVVASNSALPGQPLYSVKRLKEKVEFSLTLTEQGRAEVEAQQASERLSELEQVSAAAGVPAAVNTNVSPSTNEVIQPPPVVAEARTEAHDQVQSALTSLHAVQVKLESRGNRNAASAIANTIGRLRDEAARHQVEVQFNEADEVPPPQPAGVVNANTNSAVNINASVEGDNGQEHNGLNGSGGSGKGRYKHEGDNGQANGDEGGAGNTNANSNTNMGIIPAITSGIIGQVTLGPTCPVVRVDEEDQCQDRPYQATIAVKSADGSQGITTVTSDASGQFQVSLSAGTYLLVPQSPTDSPLPRASEQTVTVPEQGTVNVHISYDTGIR